MLVHSSYKSLLVNTETLEKRIILGLSISKLFNDPFILSENKGRYYANDLEVIGYSFVAPIIYGFMSWLIEKLDNDNYDVILFFARDGYLFEKIYKIMVEYSIKVNLPKGIYFNTSRRAITVANLDSEEEICFILKKAYKCTKKELLKQRFGIDIEDNDEQVVLSTDKNNNVKEFVLKYKDKIINNAKDEKREYLKYINNLDLKNNDKIAVFDLCSSGTIQFYLSKLINKKLHGYYFATMNVPNMFYTDYSQVESYLGNSNQYFSKYNFTKYHMLMESIFTSPKNTLIRCANNKFIYNTEETKKRNFNNISKIHNGIIEFIKDIIKNNSLMEKLDEQFLDNILGLFISNKTIVSERVKETFYTESCYDFSEEYNVWKSI